jgi:hypothetical protein
MKDARGMIPRKPDVPLHIRVEREQVARLVEVDAERIPQPAGDQFPLAAVAVGANEMAERHFRAGIEQMLVPFAGQQAVLGVMAQR